jgi:hypothetical protein
MSQISKALPGLIKQELPKPFLAPQTKLIQYSLPSADNFQRVNVKSKPATLFHPIFHDPVKRAEHIASILPDGKQLKASILDVLKTEHETELTIDAKNQKLSDDLKKKYGMDLPEFNLHMAERTQKRMAATQARYAVRNSKKETSAADEKAYQALFKPSDKEISMMQDLHIYSEECAGLNAKAAKKRFDFEKTLSPESLRTWKEAYLFSGPASPPNVRESAGYLVDTLMKRDGLRKKELNALPVPDKEILLQNTEQYLALRQDIGNQFFPALDPLSQANFTKLVLGVQHGPNTLDDQVKFIQRRIPSQSNPVKEAVLTEHIRSSLKLMRESSGRLATPILKDLVSKLSKAKEKTTESDFFMDIMPSLTEKISKLQKSHHYVTSLEPSTRIALGKSLTSLNIPMIMKPIFLLGRFAEALE